MPNAKTSVSNADSYQAIGEFWDAHDLDEHWDTSRPAEFQVALEDHHHAYFSIETALTQKLRIAARRDGVSVEVLVNSWLKERLTQELGA